MLRIGFGTDIHRLVPGRPLIVGGIRIDADVGPEGHSDADVLLHAVTDALLGALALGDIGTHFPNTDERWKDAASFQFVRHAIGLIAEEGFNVVNIDCVVDLERPKLKPFIDEMRSVLASALSLDIAQVSVKAKTGESVDSVGEGRSIRAQAIVLLDSQQ